MTSPEALEALVSSHPDPLIATDSDGLISVLNLALQQTLSLSGADVIGSHPAEVLGQPLLAAALDPSRKGSHQIDIRAQDRDYRVRSVSLAPSGGRLAVLTDVTDAREDERRRIVLVGNVSHELRTPTTLSLIHI